AWMNGNHGASVITRLIGSYRDLSYDNLFATGNDTVRSLVTKQIDSYQSWDVQYNYTRQWADDRFGTTVFTIGALDLFNADLPYREGGSINYDAGVFDGRGRRIYARVLMQL
ncbi:MAG: hypothetical protein WBJ75_14370, partial [Pseudohongiellaceae bacterium]